MIPNFLNSSFYVKQNFYKVVTKFLIKQCLILNNKTKKKPIITLELLLSLSMFTYVQTTGSKSRHATGIIPRNLAE